MSQNVDPSLSRKLTLYVQGRLLTERWMGHAREDDERGEYWEAVVSDFPNQLLPALGPGFANVRAYSRCIEFRPLGYQSSSAKQAIEQNHRILPMNHELV